jgi:hypothetical protein
VHLLLAFPLFVVVVGVDARWVGRALAKRYPELLAPDGAFTVFGRAAGPRDYLEKIFQIPFWLEPLAPATTRQMLRGLVSQTAPVRAGSPQPHSPARTDPGADGDADVADTIEADPESPPAELRGQLGRPQRRDLNPATLDIGEGELARMEELAPLISRSPRALKRFVNLYRLIKIGLDDVDAFLAEDAAASDYRVVLLLLALVSGYPTTADRLIDALGQSGGQSADTLDDLVRSLPDEEGDAERALLVAWLDSKDADPWRDTPADRLGIWAPEVARFSFGQIDAPADGAAAGAHGPSAS